MWNKHKVTILGTCVIDQRAITNSKLCMCCHVGRCGEDVLAAILRQQLATFKTTSVMSSLLCLLVCSVLYFNSRVMYAQPLPFQSCVRACVCVGALAPAVRLFCLVNVLRIPNIEDFILLFVVSLLTRTRALT